MTQKYCLFVMSAVFLLCCGLARADAAQAPFDIPRIGGIVVDGDPVDWHDQGFHVGLLANAERKFKVAEDFDPQLWLAWDDGGLLVRIRVTDDVFVEHPEKTLLWSLDAIELFVAKEVGSRVRYQPVISPGCAPKQPELRYNLYDFREDEQLRKTDLSIDVARQTIPGGYTIEARLPWKNLGITPAIGMIVGFQTYVNDADHQDLPLGERYTAMWYPKGSSQFDTTHMYPVRLSDRASASVLAMAKVTPFVDMALTWVEVNAVAERVGQSLLVSGPHIQQGEARFEKFDGRAVARCYLVTDGTPVELKDVHIAADGAAVENVALGEEMSPTLHFKTSVADTGVVTLCATLDPPGVLPERAHKAKVEIFDLGGERVVSEKVVLNKPMPLNLPDGSYLVRGQYASKLAHSVKGMTGFWKGAEPAAELLTSATDQLEKDLGSEKYADYAGWFQYQMHELNAQSDGKRDVHDERIREYIQWLILARTTPDAWNEIRGSHEWAYLSKVDQTGQPFTVSVPWNYSPDKKWPLDIFMHGSGGTHRVAEKEPGAVVVSVLGRAVDSGYWGLCEVDVLEALDYAKSHWSIDPDRIGLYGGSMGGGGTFNIGSRHPDLFASARPIAGYGMYFPVGNMLNLPTCALHGTDDYVVPLLTATSALDILQQAGGMATLVTSDGVGHGGGTEARVKAAQAWAAKQARVTKPTRVHYEAHDAGALGAYWLRAVEWGPTSAPVTMDGRILPNNSLYLTLDNATTVAIDVAKSPLDRNKPVDVTVNQQVAGSIAAPLPETIFITAQKDGWALAAEQPALPANRLHYASSPIDLYHGDPIMVVWGTHGDAATNARIRALADMARGWSDPYWPKEEDDGQKHSMLYGLLDGKPDTEVTEGDMQRCNLVLIGTVAQNSVAAKLAGRLPVRFEGNSIIANDGIAWDATNCGFALTYYNPDAPQRLVFWTGSSTPEYYQTGSLFAEMEIYSDLAIFGAKDHRVVACRNFDSRWKWQTAYASSPLVPASMCDTAGHRAAWIAAMRSGANADYVLIPQLSEKSVSFASGETRIADVENLSRGTAMIEMTLTGAQIEAAVKAFEKPDVKWWAGKLAFEPAPGKDLEPVRDYRVVLQRDTIWDFVQATQTNPTRGRLVHGMSEMLARYIVRTR